MVSNNVNSLLKIDDTKKFTWRGPGGKRSRLDYFLVSQDLESICENAKILPGYKTDHSLITLDIKLSDQTRGKGLWKFNNSLLRDREYIDLVKKTIKETVDQYRQGNVTEDYDPRTIDLTISDQLFWEMIKLQIRGKTIPYCAKKKRQKQEREEELTKQIKILNNYGVLTEDQDRQETELQNELEKLRETKTRDFIFKARATWIKEGEKCSKYFCNLEKKHYTDKLMYKLKTEDGQEITDLDGILKEQYDFYKKLYSVNPDNNNDYTETFLDHDNPFVEKATDAERDMCEGNISKGECANFLKKMSNGKSPGSDGYTCEFYKFFWKDIGDFLVRSFNDSIAQGNLSVTQRHGIITCLPKKNKSKLYLKNWRPITLLNVDYKIMSGSLAERMKPILKRIIGESQAGYLEGRDISECTRLITDMIYMTKFKHKPGLLILIDFQKAFDSLNHKYIYKCLAFYNFGEGFRKVVNVIYRNLTSSILYNGHCSGTFKVEKGVRQGDPFSPFIFIFCLDPMAAAIKLDPGITGISYRNSEYLITQLADDCTLFLDGSSCSLRNILLLLKKFSACSGLHINVDKTKAVWMGSLQGRKTKILPNEPIDWQFDGKFEILGIEYNLAVENITVSNYEKTYENIDSLLSSWAWRNLTVFGKITVIKSLALPKLVHLFRSLPDPPKSMFKKIEKRFYEFIWENPNRANKEAKITDKVKRTIMISDIGEGGANMINIRDFAASMKIFWVKKILSIDVNKSWKTLFLDEFRGLGGENIFYYNAEMLKEFQKTQNPFWKNLIRIWGEIRDLIPNTANDFLSRPLWFNDNIKVGNEVIFYHHWSKKGVNFINDLVDENGNFLSEDVLKRRFDISTNFVEYRGILAAIPRMWKNHIIGQPKNTEIKCKAISIVKNLRKPNKHMYSILNDKRKTKPTENEEKWKEILGSQNLNFKAYYNILTKIKDTNLCYFQFKVLNRIIGTNRYSFLCRYTQSDKCSFCDQEIETIKHLFFDCRISKSLWQEVFDNFRILNSFPNVILNAELVILGYTGEISEKAVGLNHLIILIKKFIFRCKMQNREPNFYGVKAYCKYYINLDEFPSVDGLPKWRFLDGLT